MIYLLSLVFLLSVYCLKLRVDRCLPSKNDTLLRFLRYFHPKWHKFGVTIAKIG